MTPEVGPWLVPRPLCLNLALTMSCFFYLGCLDQWHLTFFHRLVGQELDGGSYPASRAGMVATIHPCRGAWGTTWSEPGPAGEEGGFTQPLGWGSRKRDMSQPYGEEGDMIRAQPNPMGDKGRCLAPAHPTMKRGCVPVPLGKWGMAQPQEGGGPGLSPA